MLIYTLVKYKKKVYKTIDDEEKNCIYKVKQTKRSKQASNFCICCFFYKKHVHLCILYVWKVGYDILSFFIFFFLFFLYLIIIIVRTIDWFEHNTTHKQLLNNKQQNMFNTNATYHFNIDIRKTLIEVTI